MADNEELETRRHSDQQQDGTQDEIELEAQHSLPKPISQSLRARRSSLDRAHTMPPATWEEGDQILRDYRLRKAIREAARLQERVNDDSNSWSDSRRGSHTPSQLPIDRSESLHRFDLAGSGPPFTSRTSETGRSPSRNTTSSTSSYHGRQPQASSPSRQFEGGQMLSEKDFTPFSIGQVPGLSSARTTSNHRRPSSTRAASDGPRTSRRGSKIGVSTPLRRSLSSSVPQDGEDAAIEAMESNSPSRRRANDAEQQEYHDDQSSSRRSSMVDHGEIASTIDSEMPRPAASSSTSLRQDLRKHSLPSFDDSLYGIPKSVVIGGERIDISNMEILEQVEMLRRAQQEIKELRARRQVESQLESQQGSGSAEVMQSMPSTDLSVINEQTECSTMSRRTTIAATVDEPLSPASPSSPLSPMTRHLAPAYARSRSTATSVSSKSNLPSPELGKSSVSQAERIRNKYLRSEATKEAQLHQMPSSSAASSSPFTSLPAPIHRKYTSVGDINFHSSEALFPKASSSRASRVSASESSVVSPREASGSLAGTQTSARGPRLGKSPYKRTSQPSSNLANMPIAGGVSPSKRPLSPSIESKIARFSVIAPPLPDESLLQRRRSKSTNSYERAKYPSVFGDASVPMPVMPKSTTVPNLKSTSALVQLFEQRSGQDLPQQPSPVRDWLNTIDSKASAISRPMSASASVSSASGSMVDRESFHREYTKVDLPASSFPSTSEVGKAEGTSFGTRRRRSQSMSAMLADKPEDATDSSSASGTASFVDSQVVHHGDLYWLNSSSPIRPPFWQTCRAVITTLDELRISWLGATSGAKHERFFDLRSCVAAHSIRRSTNTAGLPVQAYAPQSLGAIDVASGMLQVFELVWPGRTQRFACTTLPSRIKWLGVIFTVLSRYSHAGSPLSEKATIHSDMQSIGSVTLRSMNISQPPLTQGVAGVATPGSSIYEVPKRQLDQSLQESLYASVSDMLSPRSGTDVDGWQPPLPPPKLDATSTSGVSRDEKANRYHLSDAPVSPGAASGLWTPISVAPKALRGAWSDVDRVSTQSEAGARTGAPAARSVARDLKRILTMMGKTRESSDTTAIGHGLPDQMKEMQMQLEQVSHDIRSASIASRHNRHAPDMISKMDELLTLFKHMAEPKAVATAMDVPQMHSQEAKVDGADPHNAPAESTTRQPDLARLEEKVEVLLDVVNRLAAMESPTGPKRSQSPKVSSNGALAAIATQLQQPEPNAAATTAFAVKDTARALPSTPSLMSELASDFDKDLAEWQKHSQKRFSALPPLPINESLLERDHKAALAQDNEQMATFHDSLSRGAALRTTQASPQTASDVSSSHVRNARSDAAMRLDGSHPDLGATARLTSNVAAAVPRTRLISKWSVDTPPVALPSRKNSSRSHVLKAIPEVRADRRRRAEVQQSREADGSEEDSSPPTPKQRDFPRKPATSFVKPVTPTLVVDPKAHEAMIIQLNSMQELLQTLVSAQSKQSAALKHQEDVSVYIKHLQEYLAEDKTGRKAEFETIKTSLNSIKTQMSGLPKEVQTLVEASLAVAALQPQRHEGIETASTSRTSTPPPAPAPDTDAPINGVPGAAVNQHAEYEAKNPPAAPPPTQSKGNTGSSLLRKVSLGISGMASAAAVQSGIRVGGPRKMGASRLFGQTPANARAPDAKDRWKAERYQLRPGQSQGFSDIAGDPTQAATGAEVNGPPDTKQDQQAQVLEALEGFQDQLAQDGENGDDPATVIALGIVEVLKMLKDNQAREYERDHYRRGDDAIKAELERERHAAELDAIRLQLREWEEKREELMQQYNKDVHSEEKIDAIIALLKDQMAHQEQALTNLKDTLSPQMNDLGAESEEAIAEIREEAQRTLSEFKAQMSDEVQKTLLEVGALRDQKKQLQSDLADLLAFKSKYGGGAPEDLAQQQQQQKLRAQQARMGQQMGGERYAGAHPPPRPDTGMSGVPPAHAWGLRGPR